ncbi:hypothetical protein SCP_0601350 [Sparassis crispa]|uniref:F-box domain-containing protein n=1 Tax=Sparassis crispa TaxID=139825 RepID=A0A401GPK9_9APHY|nr:hypothetical protein SCP_0601350 [Sparassis crispa]GBE84157.1 hypothetical protein SCP_0601350 [Sparassis crispa]
MLSLFPTDISLYILSFLSLHDLRSLLLVSRETHHLVADNESTVYHQAAVFHKFVSIRSSLEDALQVESRRCGWLEGAQSWKELCRRWTELERNWDGRGFVHEGGHQVGDSNGMDGVLHFKVDEEQRTIVAVSRSGGLTVRAMEDNRILWSLGNDYIFRARCELSKGFLVFPSSRHGLEIWRRTADVELGSDVIGETVLSPISGPSPAAALDFQFEASKLAASTHPSVNSAMRLRGQYTPHAYLGHPFVNLVRIYRLRFPVLALMSALDRNAVLIFDVCEGVLLRRVSFEAFHPIDKYLSVCLHSAVFMVPWRTSAQDSEGRTRAMVLAETDLPQDLQDASMQLRKVTVPNHHISTRHSDCRVDGNVACVPGADAVEQFEIVPPSASTRLANNSQALVPIGAHRVPPCFVSARMSPDGRHFAAVTVFGLLYLVPNFARVERGATSFSEITTRIYMGEWLRDLVWEEHQQRRLVMKAASEDIFIVNLDASFHFPREPMPYELQDDRDTFANVRISHLSDFSNPTLGWARERGVAFNGVQLTRTAVWMVWDRALLDDTVRRREHRRRQREWEDNESTEPRSSPGNGSLCFASFAAGM